MKCKLPFHSSYHQLHQNQIVSPSFNRNCMSAFQSMCGVNIGSSKPAKNVIVDRYIDFKNNWFHSIPSPTTRKHRGTAQCAHHPELNGSVLSYPIHGLARLVYIGYSIRESEPERRHVHLIPAAVAASGLARLALLLVRVALVPTTAFARPRTAGSARLRRR